MESRTYKSMITIAFHHMGGEQWTAGLVVQELMLRALRSLPEPRPSIFLTAWKETPERDMVPFLPLINNVICLPPTNGNARTRALRQNNVDVFISLPTETALTIDLPRIVWIYDFQHRHFPEYFQPSETHRMDRLFSENSASANRILIYSQAVMDDLAKFCPEALSRARLIRFVPHLPLEVFGPASSGVPLHYKLPERFFILPNRFLPHKNHAVIVEALGQLAKAGCTPVVVCTGHDQTPTAEAIVARCRELGIENSFIRLGVVPRHDYFELLRHSVAMLNPSRFEGFGLSVAEAKYLGKQTILSDLPVMREHAVPNAIYATPYSPDEWATHMKAVWEHPLSPPRPQGELQNLYFNDQKLFGKQILALCMDACAMLI